MKHRQLCIQTTLENNTRVHILRLRLKSRETDFRVIASCQSLTDMVKMTGSP